MSPEYAALNRYALYCGRRWEERGAVDWSEAEYLLALARKLPQAECHDGIQAILASSENHDDWDSDIVGNWPQLCRDPSIVHAA